MQALVDLRPSHQPPCKPLAGWCRKCNKLKSNLTCMWGSNVFWCYPCRIAHYQSIVLPPMDINPYLKTTKKECMRKYFNKGNNCPYISQTPSTA